MSVSDDDPNSPTEKNQEPLESPQDSSFLLSKETEKKIMSQESHHETSRSSVSPINTTNEEAFKSQHGSFSENPNYFSSHNITGNLMNPCGDMARSLDFGGSQSYLDPNDTTTSVYPMNTNEESLKSRHGSFLDSQRYLDSLGSQRYLDSIQMMPNSGFANKNNGDQSQLNAEASSNSNEFFAELMTQNHETWHGTTNDSSTWFTNSQHAYGEGYQSNFFHDPGGNIASMSSQRESSQPEMPWLLHNPENQMGVSRMQQNISNDSNSFMYGCVGTNEKSVDSGTSFSNYTRTSQQAYENYSDMQGNNASISSQGDSSQNVMMPFPHLLNPFGDMLGGSLDSVGSQRYLDSIQMMPNTGFVNKNNGDQSQLNVEASSDSYGLFAPPTMQSLLYNHESQMINSSMNDVDSGEGYDQSNFFLGSERNIASMSSLKESSQNVMMPILEGNNGKLLMNPSGGMLGGSQIYPDPVQMMPTSGDVKNNIDQPDLGVEGFNDNDGSHRSTSFTNDNNQRSGMQATGEGYGTNNSYPLRNQSNSFLRSGGNNASISSQGDSDEEALATFIHSFWENPLMNPSGGMLGASDEGYGTNKSEPFVHNCNIPFGSIESMMDAKREREKITMIHTPSSANRDQWPIKKILTKSDVSSSVLKLHNKKFVEQYFLKRLPEASYQDLVSKNSGIRVIVYDNEKHTMHEMRLTMQDPNYVLMGGWQKEFVKRRSLREGQEIGLFFDSTDSMLHFSVLNLENAKEKNLRIQ